MISSEAKREALGIGGPAASRGAGDGREGREDPKQALARLRREAGQAKSKIDDESGRVAAQERLASERKAALDAFLSERKLYNWRAEGSGPVGEVRALENRLEKAVVRLSRANAHNQVLRARIDHFRTEKESFDAVHRKLKRELHRRKHALSRAAEGLRKAQEERHALETRAAALASSLTKEKSEFSAERERLRRLLAEDTASPTAGGRVDRRARGGGMSYDDAFLRIRERTGVADLAQLVKRYLDFEDRHYAIGERRVRLAAVEVKRSELGNALSRFQSSGEVGAQRQRRIINGLDNRLRRAGAVSDTFATKYSQAVAVVTRLKAGLQEIFDLLECDSDGMRGCKITDSNMLQCIGAIEEKVYELLDAVGGDDATSDDDDDERGSGGEGSGRD